jgi:chromosome segregation ATPase
MQHIYHEIKLIEKEILKLKTAVSLNRVSYSDAKNRLRALNIKLEKALSRLPEHEREKYRLDKDLGFFDTIITD